MPEEIVNAATGATPSEMVEHEASTDALLDDIVGGADDVEPGSEVDADDFDDEPVDYEFEADDDDDAAPEADAEPSVESNDDPSYTQEEYALAHAALVRSGWTVEQITSIEGALGAESLVQRGTALLQTQSTNDATYSEAGRLRQQSGEDDQATTPEEGQEDGSQEANPSMTPGASDLTSLAEPVARAITEMDDEQIVPALTSFMEKAVEAQTATQTNQIQVLGNVVNDLTNELLKARLGSDFKGDLTELQPDIARLSEAGYHPELKGMDRYVALVNTASQLKGGKPAAKTSTQKARARAGSRRPIQARSTPQVKRTQDQKLDSVMDSIYSGVKDTEKLRRMGL